MLLDLYRADELPIGDMFASRDPDQSRKLMGTLDGLNARFGRNAVRLDLVAKLGTWSMRRGNLSPCYTTRIDDVLQVKAL